MSDSATVVNPSSGRGFRAAIRALVLAGCFVAGGVGTAHFIGSRLPFPPVPDLSARFRYFAGRKDEFDTIFIGSSRIRYQVIPQQFDAETAGLGAPTHSFNLGYSGMWPPESYYFLRRILALHPRRLRWVVIELMDYRFGEAEREPMTMRTAYWHDWPHTCMAWRLLGESPLPLGEKLPLFLTHARLFLQRLSNLGRGAEWLGDRYFPVKKKSDMSWVKRSGFDPEEKGEWSPGARAEYAQKIQTFERLLPTGWMRPGLVTAVRDLAAEVRKAGAEPVFLITPTVRPEENIAAGAPANLTVWAFDLPEDYPRLYLPELHFDPGHLNEAGAAELTSLLAQQLADLVRKR
jgi:hypothetical protein